MADKKKKNPRKVTPRGVFKYPRINGKPDTRFNEDGEYSVKLLLDPSAPTTAAFLTYLDEAVDAAVVEMKEQNAKHAKVMKRVPAYRNEVNDQGDETGLIEVAFKMPAEVTAKKGKNMGKTYTFKPVVVDAKGKPVPEGTRIGGGTEGKVSFEHWAYFNAKDKVAGIVRRLLGAQILALVEWSSDSAKALGFEDEDGFGAGDAQENVSDEETTTDETSDDSDASDF